MIDHRPVVGLQGMSTALVVSANCMLNAFAGGGRWPCLKASSGHLPTPVSSMDTHATLPSLTASSPAPLLAISHTIDYRTGSMWLHTDTHAQTNTLFTQIISQHRIYTTTIWHIWQRTRNNAALKLNELYGQLPRL